MITTLAQAQHYALDRVKQIAQAPLSLTEEEFIKLGLEDSFLAKIQPLLSEQEFWEAMEQQEEDFDAFLFYKIPNYVQLLETATAEFLAEYLG